MGGNTSVEFTILLSKGIETRKKMLVEMKGQYHIGKEMINEEAQK